MKKIAIFGSAFNPPTKGHLSVIQRLSHFDEVWLLPSFAHAWGKKMATFEMRCRWVEAFIKDADMRNLYLKTEEQEMALGDQAVTTYDVLSNFSVSHPDNDYTFILGPDNLLNFNKFYRSDDILQQWSILACPQSIDVRSTYVRDAVCNGHSIETYVTPRVEQMLIQDQKTTSIW